VEKVELHVLGRTHEYQVRVVNGTPVLLGPGVSCAGVDLAGEDLSGLDLSYANFEGANLSFTNCQGTRFSYARFEKATCTGMDARAAVMGGITTDDDTSWLWADLRGAEYDRYMIEGYIFDDEVSPEYLARVGIAPLSTDTSPPLGLVPVETAMAMGLVPNDGRSTDCARFERESVAVTDVLTLEEMEHRVDVDHGPDVTVGGAIPGGSGL
jgi:hypothetical protein